MVNHLQRTNLVATLALLCTLFAGSAQANARVTIVNGNAPGVGFNDPAPAVPVGGNPGTTRGQQALNAFQRAADIWGATLDSTVEIKVLAIFEPLNCTAASAVLGSAGTRSIWSDFPGAEFPNTWYGEALASKRFGADFDPIEEIRARFNSNLGNPGCLTGIPWYFGFDGNEGGGIDLVAVVLHEIGHGLGFQQFASVTNGSQVQGLTDIYGRHLLDKSSFKHWDEMTDAERVASAINSRRLVWDGAQVHADAPSVLQAGTPVLRITAPGTIAGVYQVGTAAFGPALSAAGISGQIVQALDPADAAGATTFDACSALTNAADVAGKIALVDRGTCGFIVKVKNAQNAGATAVIVADNVAGGPPAGLGGADPTIVIPSVRVTLADGNTLKANLAARVAATLGLDLTLLAGADEAGRLYMNAPNPVQPGSSVSHWDPLTLRNQLMEPSINSDLTHSVTAPIDLTTSLFRDIGWYPDRDLDMVSDATDVCLGSNLGPRVLVAGSDTGVSNTFFTNGCSIQDLINREADAARNHGDFVSGVTHLVNALRDAGVIDHAERKAIHGAAAAATTGK